MLQSKLEEVLLKLNTFHQPETNAIPRTQSEASATPYTQTLYRPVSQNLSSISRDTCKNCLEKGHWTKFCPQKKSYLTNAHVGNSRKWNNQTNVITGAETKRAPTVVYLKIRVNHRVAYGLLNSRCEHSVIKSSFVEHMKLDPRDQRLFAANGYQ